MQTELEMLRATFNYDPETGLFRWLQCTSSKGLVGKIAGHTRKSGYVAIITGKKNYVAHRLAWFLTHGVWPSKVLDHINGVKDDNRLVNLREATVSQNKMNGGKYATNTSGYKGVFWHKRQKKWNAVIRVRGKSIHLGCFATAIEAHEAYRKAAPIHHGEFARF